MQTVSSELIIISSLALVKAVLTVVSQALDMLETSKEQKTINSNLFTSQI